MFISLLLQRNKQKNPRIQSIKNERKKQMKLLHISDLHLGKRVNEFSMLEEQEYILHKIIGIIDANKPQAVAIAGDIYDKSVPSAEAVMLFDDFLYALSERKLNVFIVSGNHDSAERIAFGSRIMSDSGIYMPPVYNGKTEPVELCDEYGSVFVYMLPFIRPSQVRRFHQDAEINSYNDAVKIAVEEMNINRSQRNILITHQFVTGAYLSDSEEFFVGSLNNIDASIFEAFDYTALGHIHRPQNLGVGNIRYCGSPLKYSASEINQEKSVTIAEIGKKGTLDISEIPVAPKHDFREYKGCFEKITDKSFYDNINTDDYTFITLTDEEDIPDAVRKLKKIFPRLMKLGYDNSRTRSRSVIENISTAKEIPPEQIFAQFYKQQNNHDMSGEQLEFISKLIKEVWEEELP